MKSLERKTSEGSFFEQRSDNSRSGNFKKSNSPLIMEENGNVRVFVESNDSTASTSAMKIEANEIRNRKMAEYLKKRAKLRFKPDISDLKAKGISLDNEYKKLKIKKIRIEIAQMLEGKQWEYGSNSSDDSED